jgi:hypothetical protein
VLGHVRRRGALAKVGEVRLDVLAPDGGRRAGVADPLQVVAELWATDR